MDIHGQLRSIRISPRKVRLAAHTLKGLDATQARFQLNYLIKRSARPIMKLLDSVMANARHNFGLVDSNLFVKNVIVDEGSKLKRYRPKGFGSSSPIEKKTSHVTIILSEKVPGLKADKVEKASADNAASDTIKTSDDSKSKTTRRKTKTEDKSGKSSTGAVKRRLFQRKTV